MLIEIEKSEEIAIAMMNNGENAFNGSFLGAINEALREIESDNNLRAAVFTGSHEKYFSTGLDLNWIIQLSNEERLSFLLAWEKLLHRAFTFPKPLVAAINGHAIGAGLFFALCADWRVMRRDRGWCCVPEIDLGLELPPGNISLISHVVGSRNTDYLALTGRRVAAEEAQRVGMVDEVEEIEDVIPKSVLMARELGRKNLQQYASHKLNLRSHPSRVLEQEDPVFITEMFNREIAAVKVM